MDGSKPPLHESNTHHFVIFVAYAHDWSHPTIDDDVIPASPTTSLPRTITASGCRDKKVDETSIISTNGYGCQRELGKSNMLAELPLRDHHRNTEKVSNLSIDQM